MLKACAPNHRADRSRHRAMLVIAAMALGIAPLMAVLPGERVGAIWPAWLTLPPSCLAREAFGVDCPGCGLTRSWVHLAHGDWRASLHSHRLGWLMMLAAALQIPYRLYAMRGNGRFVLSKSAARGIGFGLIALLIGNWLINVIQAALLP